MRPDSNRRKSPRPPDFAKSSLQQSPLRALLTAHGGALHLRNLPLRTAEDFSRFIHAIAEGPGWQPHVDKGLMVKRTLHAANVATANEGPPELPIYLHNEYGLSSHHPSYISFFALRGPDVGGQTPIVSSMHLHQELSRDAPHVLEAFDRQGLAFGIHHPVERVQNVVAGESLYSPKTFGPSDGRDVTTLTEEDRRAIVEGNVKALATEGGWTPDVATKNPDAPNWLKRGYSADWQDDGSLLVLQRVPGVRTHPHLGVKTLFTNFLNYYTRAESQGTLQPPHYNNTRTFPGGKPFFQRPPYIVGEAPDGSQDFIPPREWAEAIDSAVQAAVVDIPWQTGDVLLLDNFAVQHGRRPWQGERKLLASLWDRQ